MTACGSTVAANPLQEYRKTGSSALHLIPDMRPKTDSVAKESFNILHLSDLHFGEDHANAGSNAKGGMTMVNAVVTALHDVTNAPADIPKIDHVLLGGDFISKGKFDNVDATVNKVSEHIKSLLERLSLTTQHLSLVPGNHDIKRPQASKAAEESNPVEAEKGEGGFDPYQFYKALCENLKVERNALESSGAENSLIGHTNREHPIYLSLLDSCVLEKYAEKPGARVSDARLSHLLTQRVPSGKVDPVRLMALHHNLLPIWDEPDSEGPHEQSVIMNAAGLLGVASKLKFSLILHGHQHKPTLTMYQNLFAETPAYCNPVYIAGAASAGSSPQRGFFVHQIFDHKIRVNKYYNVGVRFDLEVKKVSIPLNHVKRLYDSNPAHCDACLSDFEAQYFLPKAQVKPAADIPPVVALEDSSAANPPLLILLLVSVKSCTRSVMLIREALKKFTSGECRLDGMYHLLGKWDLLVRIRCTDAAGKIALKAIEEVLKEVCCEKDENDKEIGSQVLSKGPFNWKNRNEIVVGWEINDIQSLKTWSPGRSRRQSISRRLLKDPNKYDARRCQRSLIHIEKKSKFSDAEIRGMAEVLISGGLSKTIFEGFYVSVTKTFFVIECFTSCAETLSINKVNRAIEDYLAGLNVQKYTLTCYKHEEEECWETQNTRGCPATSEPDNETGDTEAQGPF